MEQCGAIENRYSIRAARGAHLERLGHGVEGERLADGRVQLAAHCEWDVPERHMKAVVGRAPLWQTHRQGVSSAYAVIAEGNCREASWELTQPQSRGVTPLQQQQQAASSKQQAAAAECSAGRSEFKA